MEGSRRRHGSRRVLLARLVVFGLVLSNSVQADIVNSEFYSSARALGMGNAAIAVASDPATAMFYNPAALSANKKLRFEVFSPQFEFSTANFGVTGLGNQTKLLNLNNTVPILQENPDRAVSLAFSIYPNFAAQNFAAGLLISMRGGAHLEPDGVLRYTSRYLIVPTVGMSFGTFSGLFKVGAALRGISSTQNNVTSLAFSTNGLDLDAQDIGYQKNAEEGFGIGLDVGFLFTLPWALLPTFAAVARNIGGTRFSGAALIPFAKETKRDHYEIPMTFDAGFSIAPKLGHTTVLKFALDFRDATDQTKTNIMRKVNFGMELGIRRRVYFRAGVTRGYWTAGIGLSGKKADLNISVYAEEIEPTKLRVIEDRRVVFKYGRRF